jgi:hypothetical protein
VDDNGKAHDVEMRQDYQLVEGDVPESEFFLSAFGLPEPVAANLEQVGLKPQPIDVPWQKPMPPYVWVLTGVGICTIVAIGFRYFARRRRRAGT